MDDIRKFIDKMSSPIALINNDRISYANEPFKNCFTQEENSKDIKLSEWLIGISKDKESCKNLLKDIQNKKDISINTDAYIKGTLKQLNIISFLLPKNDMQVLCLHDTSSLRTKKSYWDLHLRVNKATMELIKEISERKRLETKTAELTKELVFSARKAGMADVATSVLHNVGNILNSVKVSVAMLNENFKKMEYSHLVEIMEMIRSHVDDATTYFQTDPKGKLVPPYLNALSKLVAVNQETINKELTSLINYIHHIEGVVALQGSIGGSAKVSEKLLISEIVESAIALCAGNFEKHDITLIKEFDKGLFITSDKFKIVQIIVNLLQNAKDAILSVADNVREKVITIKVISHDSYVDILISDNGCGIPPDDITKIFSLGFTTKMDGHGYGLHNSALAAKELGGSLQASSEGDAKGSTFILSLPVNKGKGESPEKAAIATKA